MLEIARRSLGTSFNTPPDFNSPEHRCKEIVARVAHDFGMNAADIAGATRGSQKAAFARQVAMYIAHVGFSFSLVTIAKCFRRDRTTVAHACRVIEDRRDDIWFDCRMAALELACRAADRDAR